LYLKKNEHTGSKLQTCQQNIPTRTLQNQNMDLTSSNIFPVNEQTRMTLQGNEINRVGLQIPEFTAADPELWFSIMDRSFQTAGITTDSTKFSYALTDIGPRYPRGPKYNHELSGC